MWETRSCESALDANFIKLDNLKRQRYLRSLPKVELHQHLEGSLTPELLIPIAQKHKLDLPSYQIDELRPHIQFGAQTGNLGEFLKRFEFVGALFKNRDLISDLTYAVVADARSFQNIQYLELRFSPHYIASINPMPLEEIIAGVFDGIERASDETGIEVRSILIVERQRPVEKGREILRLAEKYAHRGVVGLDLANDEFNYPPGPFAPIFKAAKKAGLGVTIHAGEAAGPENVRTALEDLHADRIGHGIRSREDSELLKILKDRQIPLEISPTSNLQTGTVDKIENHPIKDFLDFGIPVVLSTDDPGICGVDLTGEFHTIVNSFSSNASTVKRLILNGVEASFQSPEKKQIQKKAFEDAIREIDEHFFS